MLPNHKKNFKQNFSNHHQQGKFHRDDQNNNYRSRGIVKQPLLAPEQIFANTRDEVMEGKIKEMLEEYQGRNETLLKSLMLLVGSGSVSGSSDNSGGSGGSGGGFDLKGLTESKEPTLQEEIKETIRNNLKNIIELPKEGKVSKSNMSVYGLDYDGKLRFILVLLKNGICPTPSRLKQAIYGESNYGSFVNAEMLMALSLKLKEMGYYSDMQNEWDDNLRRSYNSVIRYAPKASLALFHFYNSKQIIPKSCHEDLAALIYNLALALPDDSIIEDIDIQQEQDLLISLIKYFTKIGCRFFPKTGREKMSSSVFYGVFRVIQGKLFSIEKIKQAFQNDNSYFQESDDEDDLKSVLTGVSTVETYLIEVEFTELAKRSMKLRNILIDEVQRCLKHGDTKASKMEVKATDDNLIVFYVMHNRVPHVTNVYKCITNATIEQMQRDNELTVTNICDALLTCILYGDHTDYDGLCKKLLQIPPESVLIEERANLSEALKVLFIDALPTYEHVLSISNIMIHFGIVYPYEIAYQSPTPTKFSTK